MQPQFFHPNQFKTKKLDFWFLAPQLPLKIQSTFNQAKTCAIRITLKKRTLISASSKNYLITSEPLATNSYNASSRNLLQFPKSWSDQAPICMELKLVRVCGTLCSSSRSTFANCSRIYLRNFGGVRFVAKRVFIEHYGNCLVLFAE
jgi:hypothetical protein